MPCEQSINQVRSKNFLLIPNWIAIEWGKWELADGLIGGSAISAARCWTVHIRFWFPLFCELLCEIFKLAILNISVTLEATFLAATTVRLCFVYLLLVTQ